MTDSANTTPRTSARPPLALAVIGVLLLLAIIAGAGWWYLSRSSAPDWDRVAGVDLFAPAGDAFNEDTPWVSLTFTPNAVNSDVPITLALENRKGTPTPADEGSVAITGASMYPLGGTSELLTLSGSTGGSATASTLR